MLNIRQAVKSDAPTLKILLAQMGNNYQRSLQEIENRILAFNNLLKHKLLVAEENEIILGFIAFGYYEQFRLQGCCCHIDTLVVSKEYRGTGIGKILISFAEEDAKKQGATEIELTTANYRQADGTHDFYKHIGYQDHIAIDCTYFAKQRTW